MSDPDHGLGNHSPRCATHPEEAASGTCVRCGTFFCARCAQRVLDQTWCATCAARPEIHYLEQFRLKLWGRRDGSAWAALLVGIGFAVAAGVELTDQARPVPVLAFLACAGAGVSFFLGLRWGREAFIGVPLVFVAVAGGSGHPAIALLLLVLALSALTVYGDARNQLFFQRPVSRKRLERLWHLRENNPIARSALSLGIGAFFVPVIAPLAILCGVVGLRRVDPDARPPIGRRGEALAGVVLGTVALVFWSLVLWPLVRGMLTVSLKG